MLEKIGKYSCSIAVFIINIILMFLGYQVIKDNDKDNVTFKEEVNVTVQPLSSEILDAQNKIVTDRENKLRDLNNTPKPVKTQKITTETKTVTPKADTKTKNS